MSLGLVCTDGQSIYLAADSRGLEDRIIPSKLHQLEDSPPIAIVVTGGIAHWRYVFENYRSQGSLTDACREVVRLLNEAMDSTNQAYCRLCGFQKGKPVCYQIDRPCGVSSARVKKVPLNSVVAVGSEHHWRAAQACANEAIMKGANPESALREAIKIRIPGIDLSPPVESMKIQQ